MFWKRESHCFSLDFNNVFNILKPESKKILEPGLAKP